MPDAIRSVRVMQHRLTPMEADLRIVVEVDNPAGAELRGRVHGPMCPGIETVQVAYPVRLAAGVEGTGDRCLTARVVIPEPNLWTCDTPFVYEAVLELWRDGRRVETTTHSFGLSMRPG